MDRHDCPPPLESVIPLRSASHGLGPDTLVGRGGKVDDPQPLTLEEREPWLEVVEPRTLPLDLSGCRTRRRDSAPLRAETRVPPDAGGPV
jgi:hypothetical protein